MKTVVLDRLPLQLDPVEVFKRVRVEESSPDAPALCRLIRDAQGLGVPKALYRAGYIEARTDDTVTVDGIVFASRVLRVNTDQAHQVFAYLATCGTELEAWGRAREDMLERYWADAIMELALRQAIRFLNEQLGRVVAFEKTSVMNPGSLADWPIQQQRPLFELIGPASAEIGVCLTDSLLMTPAKSVSGLRFATEVHFENCQLCPRKECPGRRATYDKELYAQRYARGASQEATRHR